MLPQLDAVTPPLQWLPEVGDFTMAFLRRKANEGPTLDELTHGSASVLFEAARILGRCRPPSDTPGSETGLVVGYVQSGKTLSFETVISLSRDNGYGLVIVLAGTQNNLRDQSEKRLKKDLGIEDGENWLHFSNPRIGADRTNISDRLKAWKRQPRKRRATLITVLKQVTRLKDLAALVECVPLDGVPVLIIDDEGDQASLNTKAAKIRKAGGGNEASAVHAAIADLRAFIPHHSFLQYTATPQAPLLLSQADLLNPGFAEVVTPGRSYTGGIDFFKSGHPLVEDIPEGEVPSKDNDVSSPPKTLLRACRYFLLAAAQHALTRSPVSRDRNRSMMVHPSQLTDSHKRYKIWVDRCIRILRSRVEAQLISRPADVEAIFASEFSSISSTSPIAFTLRQLLHAMVEEVFPELRCVEVNATEDAERNIDWRQFPYWILVGGQKLDRGYTVEGLCTTYMPRPLGSSPAADTLQQRARFFGYKRDYLGLCRVFVQAPVREAFEEYVEHEEFVRSALEKARGKSLRTWRRDFILTPILRPTRPAVIGLETRRVLAQGWIVPGALHADEHAVEVNSRLIERVLPEWMGIYGPSSGQATEERVRMGSHSGVVHLTGVDLGTVLSEFLLEFEITDPRDAEDHAACLMALAEVHRLHCDVTVDVYAFEESGQYRSRSDGRGYSRRDRRAPIGQYFSATANAINDKSFVSANEITLQIRRFDVGPVPRDKQSADVKRVPWFAVHIPSPLSNYTVIEER